MGVGESYERGRRVPLPAYTDPGSSYLSIKDGPHEDEHDGIHLQLETDRVRRKTPLIDRSSKDTFILK